MDTRQVEYAVAVAEERSFTRAAARVHAVQSTVSAGVRALERELGAALFERDPHGVRLTAAGTVVLPSLRAVLAAAARARGDADPIGELRGELRIGIFSNLSYLDLPGIAGRFHREHPAVDLRLRPSATGSAGLAEDVRRGRLDLALYGSPGHPGPGLAVRRIAAGPFAAFLPAGHPLAGRDALRLADLAGERFIETPAGFGNRAAIDAAFAAAGLGRVIATEIAELGSLPRFVAAGLGIAIAPPFMIEDPAGTVAVPIAPRLDWELGAITRPEPDPAVRAFLDLLPTP